MMDKDLSLLILTSFNRSTRELEELIPFLKAHAESEDYEHLRSAIGTAIHEIMLNIMDYVEARCPEIHAEKERRLAKFGRAY